MTTLHHMSLYRYDQPASKDEIKAATRLLAQNYCQQADGFWKLLIDTLLEERYTRRRLNDAVKHLFRYHPYARICLVDILSYDKYLHVLTYQEIEAHHASGTEDQIGLVEVGGTDWVVHRAEAEACGYRVKDFRGLNAEEVGCETATM